MFHDECVFVVKVESSHICFICFCACINLSSFVVIRICVNKRDFLVFLFNMSYPFKCLA